MGKKGARKERQSKDAKSIACGVGRHSISSPPPLQNGRPCNGGDDLSAIYCALHCCVHLAGILLVQIHMQLFNPPSPTVQRPRSRQRHAASFPCPLSHTLSPSTIQRPKAVSAPEPRFTALPDSTTPSCWPPAQVCTCASPPENRRMAFQVCVPNHLHLHAHQLRRSSRGLLTSSLYKAASKCIKFLLVLGTSHDSPRRSGLL